MLKFLLQTIDGKVRHDFVFQMEHAVDYHNWRSPNSMFVTYCSLEELDMSNVYNDYIPVGTIEYVYKYIDKYVKKDGSKEIHPINVPKQLEKYAGGHVWNVELNDTNRHDVILDMSKSMNGMNDQTWVYVKSSETIKFDKNGQYHVKDLLYPEEIPNGKYQVRQMIKQLVSEYRCFVYKGQLVGIQYYSGDFKKFPDVDRILDMSNDYMNSPQAYTLDIGVTKDGQTCLMEVHEFFSCGLYGFDDYKCLPYMFVRTFQDIKGRLLKK